MKKPTIIIANKNINYKDVIIIFALWYIIAINVELFTSKDLIDLSIVSGFLHYFFVISGRFTFLALTYFYFVSIYDAELSEIGFWEGKKHLFNALKKNFSVMLLLFGGIIFLINLPFSLNSQINSTLFNPLITISNIERLGASIFPALIIFVGAILIGFSEQFLVNKVIYPIFAQKLITPISIMFSALFFSFLLLEFTPEHILINIIYITISILMFRWNNEKLIYPVLFSASYYTAFITFITGFNYLKF